MGNTKVALNIGSNNHYLHPFTDILSNIGIKGEARIVNFEDHDEVADIHIELLKNYDPNSEYEWISNLIQKLKNAPKKAWLIKVKPTIRLVINIHFSFYIRFKFACINNFITSFVLLDLDKFLKYKVKVRPINFQIFLKN